MRRRWAAVGNIAAADTVFAVRLRSSVGLRRRMRRSAMLLMGLGKHRNAGKQHERETCARVPSGSSEIAAAIEFGYKL